MWIPFQFHMTVQMIGHMTIHFHDAEIASIAEVAEGK